MLRANISGNVFSFDLTLERAVVIRLILHVLHTGEVLLASLDVVLERPVAVVAVVSLAHRDTFTACDVSSSILD